VSSSLGSSRSYKRYVLGILTIILLFNSLDRVALGILLQTIKVEFDLSDTQLGVLTGIAFALFYSIMGLPIARWADTGNRVTVISLACALWSIAVALCGAASSFLQLLLIRVVVSVGEAGCVPPAFSLMADYFTRAERPRAVAIYVLGGSLSAVVGYSLAGWLNDHYGWRITFVALGAPGVLIGLLAWLTLKEPRLERSIAFNNGSVPEDVHGMQRPVAVGHPTVATVWATVSTNVTFRRLLLCLSGLLFFNIGIAQWMPSFFIRTHGFTSEQVGAWLALVVGVGGLPGAYVGGELAARYAVNNESLQLRAVTAALCCAGVAAFFAYVTSNPYVAFTLFGLHIFALFAINGPLFATMQTLIPERMRAMAFAIAYLVANLLGLGFGPIAAGALSDLYRGWAHEDSLRYALLTLSPGYLIVAWYAWRASTSVTADIARVSADGEIELESDAAPLGAEMPRGARS
jgi:MFS transporter, Spinster family, sphingosine-1-phosphate transporter